MRSVRTSSRNRDVFISGVTFVIRTISRERRNRFIRSRDRGPRSRSTNHRSDLVEIHALKFSFNLEYNINFLNHDKYTFRYRR